MENTGKITVEEFLADVSKLPNNEAALKRFYKNHVVKTFVDYETKIADVRRITDVGNYVAVTDPVTGEERAAFKRNSPTMEFLLRLRLILHYSDLQMDVDSEKGLAALNDLERVGAVDGLLAAIPSAEMSKWREMMKMMNDDILLNERDFASYMDTRMDSMQMMLKTMQEGLESVIKVMGKEE